ncbi:MAG: hypothetical protein WD059_05615 [Balneolaceae bacterium]
MTNKDRRIQLFLQIFYLLVGIYTIINTFGALYSSRYPDDIFDFYNSDIPVFSLAAGFITGFAALLSSFTLWTKVNWAFGFAIFTSGLLLCYNLLEMGNAIFRNPYEAVPMVIILVIVLQSFPFLLKQTDRHL